MAYSLREMLRIFGGGDAKPKPVFSSEKDAYDFCRSLYNKTGGVTPELRRAYEFYQKNYNDDCASYPRFEHDTHLGAQK